jgi:glycine oxidase
LTILADDSLNIAIAGGGIMGRMLAWQLANAGHKITLFDKDPIEQGSAAAYTAAGMLTPYSEVESAELSVHHMGMQSLRLWPKIIEQLGGNVGYHSLGSLVISHPCDQSDRLRFNQQLLSKLSLDQSQFQNLDQIQLQQYEPELSDQFDQATWLPEEAWLSAKCVMAKLAENLFKKQITWLNGTLVEEVAPYYLIANGKKYQFDWVIDCRGLGAKKQLPNLRGVRGELLWLQAPDVKINRLVRLMHPRYRLYIVPQLKDDLYVVGATQIESDDMSPISVRSSLELLSAAYSLHSGFAEARVVESKTNCRPALYDNLPKVKIQAGLMHVNGLYRHGFLLAPTIAQEVDHWIQCGEDYQSPYRNLIETDLIETGLVESRLATLRCKR